MHMNAPANTDHVPGEPHASQPPKVTRVLCVDDHRDIRRVLEMLIDAAADMQCVGCLGSADTLVEEVRRLQADVVLMDAIMPGKDPFVAVGELSAEHPDTGIIVFSAWDRDEVLIRRAKEAGARGWVSKDADPDTVLEALREVAAGGRYFDLDTITDPSSRG